MVQQLTKKNMIWKAQRSHLVQRTDAATFIRILWDLMELWSEPYKMGTHSRLGYENVHTRTPCAIYFSMVHGDLEQLFGSPPGWVAPFHHLSFAGKYCKGTFRQEDGIRNLEWHTSSELTDQLVFWQRLRSPDARSMQAYIYVCLLYLVDEEHVVGLHLLHIYPDVALAVQVILAAEREQKLKTVTPPVVSKVSTSRWYQACKGLMDPVLVLLEHMQPLEVLLVIFVHQVCVGSMLVQGWITLKKMQEISNLW